MDTPESTGDNFNDRLEHAASIIENDPTLNDDGSVNQNTPATNANGPAGEGDIKPPVKDAIDGDLDKTKDTGKDKPQDQNPAAIEPPTTWSSEDKAAFQALPEWAQQTIVRRESERESYLGERSRVLAAREQEVSTVQSRAQQAQQEYAVNLERAAQLVETLMPAKFADIQNQADYLRVKVEDPARAGEYEVFTTLLQNANKQRADVQQQRAQQHLDQQWQHLQTKYPEFKDDKKAETILNDVRKACIEHYGYNAAEVATIPDHRQVQIVRDAIAWRQHQANIKAAESKRVPNTPNNPVLRQNGNSGSANLSNDAKTKVLNRADKTNDLRKKADILASLIVQGE